MEYPGNHQGSAEVRPRNIQNFKSLSCTTIDAWIDRSGDAPKWSSKTLERIKRGNEVGHANAGRKGVLVWA